MSAMSDFLELKILDHITGRTAYTKPSAVYLGLSTGDFTDTGSGSSELTGNNYSRVSVAFDAAASGATSNTSAIDFAAASGNWGTVSHWALFDAASGGNALITGSFSASKTIETNDVLRIAAGDLDLTAA
jgi:hypothetical protein